MLQAINSTTYPGEAMKLLRLSRNDARLKDLPSDMVAMLKTSEGRSELLKSLVVNHNGDLDAMVSVVLLRRVSTMKMSKQKQQILTKKQLIDKYGDETLVERIIADKVKQGMYEEDPDNPGGFLYLVNSKSMSEIHMNEDRMQMASDPMSVNAADAEEVMQRHARLDRKPATCTHAICNLHPCLAVQHVASGIGRTAPGRFTPGSLNVFSLSGTSSGSRQPGTPAASESGAKRGGGRKPKAKASPSPATPTAAGEPGRHITHACA